MSDAPDAPLDDRGFDATLVASAFGLAALDGWGGVSVAAAARDAGLPLDRARARFPGRDAILIRFGSLADQEALAAAGEDGTPRERLFDLLMRRFDALQHNRDGVIALLRGLPLMPGTAALLAAATLGSMGWMLEAAGLSARGPIGRLRAKALLLVWLQAVRVWQRDDSADLSGTMASLDRSLGRVAELEAWWRARRGEDAPVPDFPPDPPVAAPPPMSLPPTAPPPPPEVSGSPPV